MGDGFELCLRTLVLGLEQKRFEEKKLKNHAGKSTVEVVKFPIPGLRFLAPFRDHSATFPGHTGGL